MNGEALDGGARSTETVIAAPRHALPLRALAAIGGTLARWWRGYRSEASLLNARDDMLKDMGLSRAELEQRIGGRPYY
jgi:uncharacterized protein YjiS (DUF1127 family)